MEFSVEFYETSTGHCPVREFLDELKDRDPDVFAAILAGLGKLRNRRYHREPLSKALNEGALRVAPRRQIEHSRALVVHERAAHHRRSWHPQQRASDCRSGSAHGARTHGRLEEES